MKKHEEFRITARLSFSANKKTKREEIGRNKKTVEEKMVIVLLCSTKDGDIHLIYQSVGGLYSKSIIEILGEKYKILSEPYPL